MAAVGTGARYAAQVGSADGGGRGKDAACSGESQLNFLRLLLLPCLPPSWVTFSLPSAALSFVFAGLCAIDDNEAQLQTHLR